MTQPEPYLGQNCSTPYPKSEVLCRWLWLGADVFVGPGVKVGELCVVGARSVVMKNLPPRMIGVDQPCQSIKPRPEPL